MLVDVRGGIPIGRRRGSPRPGGPATDGLLIVGHGSRCAVAVDQVRAIADLVAAAPELDGVAVDVGFLEMSDPPAGPVLDRLVARGCRRIVVLPLMLLAAGHGKSDVPAVVLEGRERHPDVDIVFGSPFGVVHDLVDIAGDNLARVGGDGLPLLVIARGTSDPDANAEAHKAGRLVAEWSKAPFAQTGFTGVTTPLVPDALEMCRRLGADRLAVFFWFLCHGKLIERARDDMATFAADSGVELVDAGYLGPDPRLVPTMVARYREALDGRPTLNCDTCSYRLPFPGHEDRVGQPAGVGHSHLAAEHRHGHDHGHGHHHH
ncbi:MAG: sirohydrochlorin chelatase [Actinomycetota bacterium]|nr:sirohydrochlorin chelatase [Actinomycetota bacterium]